MSKDTEIDLSFISNIIQKKDIRPSIEKWREDIDYIQSAGLAALKEKAVVNYESFSEKDGRIFMMYVKNYIDLIKMDDAIEKMVESKLRHLSKEDFAELAKKAESLKDDTR